GRHLGDALFLQASSFARQFTQVVELGAPHAGALDHLDLVDPRRVHWECALHADTIRDAPDRERRAGAASTLSDHHAFEGLEALLLTLHDLDEHLHGVAGREPSPVLLELCCIDDADRFHDTAPRWLGSLPVNIRGLSALIEPIDPLLLLR